MNAAVARSRSGSIGIVSAFTACPHRSGQTRWTTCWFAPYSSPSKATPFTLIRRPSMYGWTRPTSSGRARSAGSSSARDSTRLASNRCSRPSSASSERSGFTIAGNDRSCDGGRIVGGDDPGRRHIEPRPQGEQRQGHLVRGAAHHRLGRASDRHRRGERALAPGHGEQRGLGARQHGCHVQARRLGGQRRHEILGSGPRVRHVHHTGCRPRAGAVRGARLHRRPRLEPRPVECAKCGQAGGMLAAREQHPWQSAFRSSAHLIRVGATR